jgi:nucleotide-binding universal stress UspA family protein
MQDLVTDIPGRKVVAPRSPEDEALQATMHTPSRAGLRRVVVPLDGSLLAWAALPVAIHLARLLDAEVILVQAMMPAHVPGIDEDLAYQLGETDAYRSLHDAALVAKMQGLATAEVLATGDFATEPTEAILAAAGEFDAGLIVMATHGRTGIERAVLGSVADEVVARSSVPVVLVHPQPAQASGQDNAGPAQRATPEQPGTPPERPRIVVALDGSPASEASLEPAVALAQAIGGALDLIRILPEEESLTAREADLAARSAQAERYLQSISLRLQGAGLASDAVRVAVLPAAGPRVADALLQYAQDHHALLLVIATHARRGIARLLRGSVEAAVISKAPLPVLVVRAAP